MRRLVARVATPPEDFSLDTLAPMTGSPMFVGHYAFNDIHSDDYSMTMTLTTMMVMTMMEAGTQTMQEEATCARMRMRRER